MNKGDIFNYFTVIKLSHYDKHHRKHYLCKCRCGVRKTVQMSLLRSGNTKSCGCYKKVASSVFRLPNHGAMINNLILQYKRHARDRGIYYDLNREEFDSIVRMNCHYCNSGPSSLAKNKNCKSGFRYNGIDRVDSSVGYVSKNVVPCCKKCNIAKMKMDRSEFLGWISAVYHHSILNK